MTTYLVAYGSHPGDDFQAVPYATRDLAVAAAAAEPSGYCALVISSERDITISGPTLAAAYSALTGKAVTRFESRETGVRRFMEALKILRQPLTVGEDAMAKSKSSTKVNRRARYAISDRIVILKPHTCKPGKKNHARLQHLRDGMTVGEALAAGLQRPDLKTSVEREWIRVDPSPIHEDLGVQG